MKHSVDWFSLPPFLKMMDMHGHIDVRDGGAGGAMAPPGKISAGQVFHQGSVSNFDFQIK